MVGGRTTYTRQLEWITHQHGFMYAEMRYIAMNTTYSIE